MHPPQAAANQHADASPLKSDFVSPVDRVTLVLLLAAACAVRLLCLSRKPFWFDECFSVEVARIDWSNFLHLLWWREANMSLYYTLLRLWLHVEPYFNPHLARSEFFVRSLSTLIAVATLPAVYWLAGLLYDRRVALIAAALFTFNGYSVRYSQEARSYALFLLLATLSSGLLIASLRNPVRRNRVSYIVVSALAAYAHFYALLLVGTQWLAFRRLGSIGDADQPGAAIASGMRRVWIAIGIAVLPLLIFVAKTGAGPIRWIPRPGLRDVLAFYERLAGSGGWLLAIIYAAACIAAVAPLGKRLLGRHQDWETWRCQFLLIWLFFPVALTVLLSFARPLFLGRYMIFCLPPLLILVAAGLSRFRPAWLLATALAGILLLCLQGIFFVYGHDFDNERDASEAASNLILDHSLAGDAIVFHIAETRVPYEFFRSVRAGENTASPKYTAQLGPEILFPHHAAGLDYRDFTGKPTADFLRTAAPNYARVWVMLMNNVRAGNPDPTTLMLTQILAQSFPKIQIWKLDKVEVRLYTRQ
jgi:4-amino-4-deoxy-L-arabinose transferase-like glycosyltransferase